MLIKIYLDTLREVTFYQTAAKARPACMVFSKPSIACLRVLNTDIMLH